MNKRNLIIIILLIICIVIISGITLYKIKDNNNNNNNNNVDPTPVTIDEIISLDKTIKENAHILTLDMFKKYSLLDQQQDGEVMIYDYYLNDKYKLEVKTHNDLITSVLLINKASLNQIDLLYESLDRFLQFD